MNPSNQNLKTNTENNSSSKISSVMSNLEENIETINSYHNKITDAPKKLTIHNGNNPAIMEDSTQDAFMKLLTYNVSQDSPNLENTVPDENEKSYVQENDNQEGNDYE